jgi:hypothetical protein
MDNMGPTAAEAKASAAAIDKTINFFTSKRGILVIVIAVLTLIALIYGVYSLINGWVQCMDGSNYARKIIDGETLYIDTCDAY